MACPEGPSACDISPPPPFLYRPTLLIADASAADATPPGRKAREAELAARLGQRLSRGGDVLMLVRGVFLLMRGRTGLDRAGAGVVC
jgi:Cft2 family RNA processing exonuclease